ncbi:hypothetical protein [Sphingomonas prati]|uniref:Uncharacterized protein n=1 Tax=Sphingomonas prati TaxID=1843237 RepID=A0A7W9BU66_9SPHN|nr:hypothetical protein [Sphingomonas prati]MBB5729728.1 hypothetical protein [Sphingomonas prati]GGE89934.1 hypothetical protein GCM10011404_23550 [Sphingomonas prati]
MLKLVLTIMMVATPAFAHAIPTGTDHPTAVGIFSTAELNNLARLDEAAPPARLRRMEYEIADLRDQVGRMKLDRLIDTVIRQRHR